MLCRPSAYDAGPTLNQHCVKLKFNKNDMPIYLAQNLHISMRENIFSNNFGIENLYPRHIM